MSESEGNGVSPMPPTINVLPSTSAPETVRDYQRSASEQLLDEELPLNQEMSESIRVEMKVTGEEEMSVDKQSNKREREDESEDKDFEIVLSKKEKKVLRQQESVEIYIYCKEKLPKQFALARLLKEVGIVGVNKIKYINQYKIRLEAKNEVVAGQIMFCKRFTDMDWRFQRALDVNLSYGVIKEVDSDLTDDDILNSVTCSPPAVLVAAKRLHKRDEEGKWVPCHAVRLAFSGTVVPSYVLVDHLRIAVETYRFPVTQCSRCWKLGHIAQRCSSRNIVCPKCSGPHENCTVTEFRCSNCAMNHMALEKMKCPVYLKEKRVRELMSEFRCTYKMALLMFVQPDSPDVPIKKVEVAPPDETPKKAPTFSWYERKEKYETEAKIEMPKVSTEKGKEKKRQEKRKISKKKNKENNWWKSYSESESEFESESEAVPPKKNQGSSKGNPHPKRDVTFRELVQRIKEVIFMRDIIFREKIGVIIKLCLEWLFLVVMENLSEWPVFNSLMELMLNI